MVSDGCPNSNVEAGFRAEADKIIQREVLDLVANDLGDARLRNAEAFRSLSLGEALPVDPASNRLRELAPKYQHRGFVGRKAEVEKDVPAGGGAGTFHGLPPIDR